MVGSVGIGMGDLISMSFSGDSLSGETLNRGPLALLLRRQYEFPFGINIVQFSNFNQNFCDGNNHFELEPAPTGSLQSYSRAFGETFSIDEDVLCAYNLTTELQLLAPRMETIPIEAINLKTCQNGEEESLIKYITMWR